jgi:hypothetical protein
MKRKVAASLTAENLAHAATFLRCDLYWLCTGEGGEYVPQQKACSTTALETADWIDSLEGEKRARAYAFVNLMRQGRWPTSFDDAPLPRGR